MDDTEQAKAYNEGYKNGIADCVQALPETKEIGYSDEEKELPTLNDEFKADLYETKAEAWFAGWDEAVKSANESLKKFL